MSHALSLGGGRPTRAGLLAMSGFIPRADGFELDLADHRALPVALTHGTQDPIIEVGFGREAASLLGDAGLEVLYRETPVGHTVDPRLLPELRAWLRRVTGGEDLSVPD